MKTLKLIISGLILSLGGIATAQEVIVDYGYGNQIYQSTLQIYTNGAVKHVEKGCCPPHRDDVAEKDLSPQKLSDLKNWIQEASQAVVLKSNGHATTDGSDSRSLDAFQNGNKTIVHTIDRGTGKGPVDTVHKNPSNGARQIEDLVNTYVKYRMYQ